MTQLNTLLLVDGSSYLYRAYHAMPDLRANPSDPTSQATGAIRGMVNMLNVLRREYPASYAACVFDASGKTFRDDLYAEYKANRSPMPDDLRSQIEPIHEVVKLLGWQVLSVAGVEADDVIGTLAHTAAQAQMQVVVSSGDKDLSQLVNERITIIDTMSGKVRDVAGVNQEFGVAPELMIDYQALVGDTVDNIPGVNKVGPKTAVKWLEQYGSLDAIMEQADSFKGKVGEYLRDALEWLPTARQLVTIKRDCDLAEHVPSYPRLDSLQTGVEDTDALVAFYQRYGFNSLIRNLQNSTGTGGAAVTETDATPANVPPVPDTVDYQCITTQAQLAQWLEQIQQAELTGLDTETTSLDTMQARIVGISLSTAVGQAAYIPTGHDYPGAPDQLPLDVVLDTLRPWLESAEHKKVGAHIKYDRHVFANHGITVRGFVEDVMLQSYVVEVHQKHGLESLAQRHVGRKGFSYEELCGKGAKQIPFSQVDVERACTYACEDADYTLHVWQVLHAQLEQHDDLQRIYALEIATSETLFRMEREGVLIDQAELQQQNNELGNALLKLEEQAYELAEQEFKLGSPKQIGEIFFDKLGYPVIKKTPSGKPSTNEEVLEKLAEDYPLPKTILQWRGLSKLRNTYTDKLGEMVNADTGRIHTNYGQAIAVTGRLSSSDPNLQNIPIRTEEGRRIRRAFVARDGFKVASADYSQIELRIMAHISGDAALLKAFRNGDDVHRATASEVFGVTPEAVSNEQRRYAKVINFGLIYGMSSYGLARNLGIDNTAAKNYIDRYFDRYPGVKTYMDETRASAKERGYVQTIFGRRLYLPEIRSPNGPRRAGAERAAINAPMQGTAADLIKMSMNAVLETLDKENKRSKLIMQVHDELVLEVAEDEVQWAQQAIPDIMCSVAELNVPLVVEMGVADDWDAAH